MIVKLLGGIDLAASLVLLMMTFELSVLTQLLVFFSGLLFLKGLFVFGGDVLSIIDLFACGVFLFTLFFTIPIIFLWVASLLLLAKGIASFM